MPELFDPSGLLPPYVPDRGPKDAVLAIVGEAPGDQESIFLKPFRGKSGAELERIISDAGLDPKSIYFTNVFPLQPPDNAIHSFFCSKKEAGKTHSQLPPMGAGKYLRPEFIPFIQSLHARLAALPNLKLICPVGNTAMWALLGKTGIGALRGTIFPHTASLQKPILPTFHPAAVLRQWALRSTVVADFGKAASFLSGDLVAPNSSDFTLHLDQSLDQLHLLVQRALESPILGIDVETEHNQIRTVGIALSETEAFVIPFFDMKAGITNYWINPVDELKAWHLVRTILESPVPKVMHNGMYDTQRLFQPYSIIPKNFCDDTMLLHHALQPEMKKSLDFLSSAYLNTSAWKAEYRRAGAEQTKRDE